ncbi:MAG: hypothetical protein GX444_09670 [Myxococcales bacterium]|nr:hypothetical protein [Myxococcales bacterium]
MYEEWIDFYRVENETAIKQIIPDTQIFASGSLGSAQIGWAAGETTLYHLDNGSWGEFEPQPPVAAGAEPALSIAPQRFADGTGYALSGRPPSLYFFDGESWGAPLASFDIGTMLQCRAKNSCLLFNDNSDTMTFFDGSTATVVNDFPPGEDELISAILSGPETAYAVWGTWEGDDMNLTLYRYENATWIRDERFEQYAFRSAVLDRINDDFVTLNCDAWSDDPKTLVLGKDGEIIDPDWPRLFSIAFAPGGGGIAKETTEDVVYLIKGTELIPLYSFATITGAWPTNFLVAADAE